MGKKVGRKPNEEGDLLWYSRATKVLKGEMLRLGVSTADLQSRLQKIGINYERDALSKKIHRGGFSFAFFLQCMRAMDVAEINLYMTFEPTNTVARFEQGGQELYAGSVPANAASHFLPDLGMKHGEKMKLIDDEDPAYQRKGGESDPES